MSTHIVVGPIKRSICIQGMNPVWSEDRLSAIRHFQFHHDRDPLLIELNTGRTAQPSCENEVSRTHDAMCDHKTFGRCSCIFLDFGHSDRGA